MDRLEAIERLARLKESGVLTDAEFNNQKQRILSGVDRSEQPLQHRDSTITGEERDLDVFRGSTIGWLLGSFAGWMTLLLCISPALGLLAPSDTSFLGVTLYAASAGLVIILLRWIANISATYELSTQRLLLRTGIIFKRIDEIELFRVKDVRVDFSLINQITGIGMITLRTSDATSQRTEFRMRDIPRARQIRETIRAMVEQARYRRRVREFDVDEGFY